MRSRQAGGMLYCPVCMSEVKSFLPHGNPLRENAVCPVCQSKACHRLCWGFFSQSINLFRKDGLFLHIAPEPELSGWLQRKCKSIGMQYQSGDIRDQAEPLDIESTGLPSGSIDVLFACHVLNMVCDDARAIREISRILTPDGTAVLPVPVSKATPNMREADPKSEERERLAMFGDPNMYRAYTVGEYSKRLSNAGLLSTVFTTTDISVDGSNRWMVADESIQIARHLSAGAIVVPA